MVVEINNCGGRGFTLIEMVITLAIIATLVAILTPVVTTYVDQARVAKAQSDVRTIGDAISRFERDVGRYPMFTTGSGALADSTGNVITLRGPGFQPADTGTVST